MPIKNSFKDIAGQKFGKLTAIKYVRNNNCNRSLWLFRCDCGNEKILPMSRVCYKSSTTHSCGCLTKHHKSKTRFYRIWKDIKSRCLCKNDTNYHHYGGRGIKTFWNDYFSFQEDMHQSYQNHCEKFGIKNTTIDRRDNDGNYCKENCRWATVKEQMRNTRVNHYLGFNGENLCVEDWAIKLGVPSKRIFARLHYKQPIEKILSTIDLRTIRWQK